MEIELGHKSQRSKTPGQVALNLLRVYIDQDEKLLKGFYRDGMLSSEFYSPPCWFAMLRLASRAVHMAKSIYH